MSVNDDKTVIMGRGFRVAPGTRLNGIYEIESLIGTGGMSEIYKGRNIQTQDDVAIKVILPEFAQDEQMVALFRREALTLNRLSNEAIVRYHVFSHDPAANLLYLAMEFVDGPTLRDSMKQRPLSQQEACLLISKVAAGMQVAHAEGVIHRDLSTDNIILAGNSVSKPKVIDFGIARSSEINDSTLIASGFAGKYNFVSPEQLGLFGGKVQEASDVYSLGLVFAAALLGRPLNMAGSHADVVMKRQSVPDLSMINPGVRPLIESMLQPRPAMRPQNMGDIADALQKWLPARGEQTLRGSRPVRARPVSLAGSPVSPEQRRGWGRVFALLILALCAGGAWYGMTQTGEGRKLAAIWLEKITGAAADQTPVAAAPPTAPVTPSTGKSEIKAGDPGEAAGSEAKPAGETAAEAEPETARLPATATATVEPESESTPVGQAGEATAMAQQGNAETPAIKAAETTPETSAGSEPSPKPLSGSEEPSAKVVAPVDKALSAPEAGTEIAAKIAPSEPDAPAKPNPSEWVTQYDGGACFHVVGTGSSGSTVGIEGFGDRVEPFEKLDKAFQNAFGFEAQIRLRAVTKPQCPVIEFARQSKSSMAFSLKSDLLKKGEAVDASLAHISSENVSIFVVTPDGIIVNVTAMSSRYDDEINLQIPGDALKSKAGSEYLLFAVASDRPLAALDMKSAADPAAFLQALRKQGEGGAIRTAVKYLRKK